MQMRILIYPAFLLVCFLVFMGTTDYGFVTDYLGWLNAYRDGSLRDVVHCFGYPGNHQFFHLVNYGLFKLIGSHQMAMGFVFIFAHASVCYLIYRTFRLLLEAVALEQGGLIALFAAIFSALSPYAIEPLTWDACFHYLLVTGLIFGALNFLARYVQTQKTPWLLLHFLLFFLALYTLELSLVAPGIFLLYLFFMFWVKNELKTFRKNFILLTPIYLALLAFYFISTKWMIGTWVGHYGAEKHLNFDPLILVSTLAKYFVKQVFFVHFWKFTWKEQIYAKLDNGLTAVFFLLAIASLLLFMFQKSKHKLLSKLVLTGTLGFVIGLLPILNLFFVWIGWYENDRYSYYAAPHLYLAISALFIIIFKKKYGIAWLVFVFINSFFLSKMIGSVKSAGKLTNELSASFDFYDHDHVVLLCTPENTAGVLVFRDYSDVGITLNESLDWLGKGLYQGNMTNLVQWNPTTEIDSLNVKIIAPNMVQVDIASWGTWFWRKGAGLSNFENEHYKVINNGLSFTVEAKDTIRDRIFIFNKGIEWKSIKLPIDEN